MRLFAKTVLVGIGLLWTPAGVSGQDPALVAEGARGWSQNCTRCHNARSPLERNDADWAIIVGHMRARANLTKRQATAIATYLQAVNHPERMQVVITPPPPPVVEPTQAPENPQKPPEKKPARGSGG